MDQQQSLNIDNLHNKRNQYVEQYIEIFKP